MKFPHTHIYFPLSRGGRLVWGGTQKFGGGIVGRMAESTLKVYESKFGDAKFISRESVYSSEDESKIPDLEFKIFMVVRKYYF